MSSHDFLQKLERFSSGVRGLDRILGGGFFVGGVYILEGMPGAGKTILANQIAFHQVASGRRALYVTLLAESHARLLQHLQGLSFFAPQAIPDRLTYVSGFRSLEETGLAGLLELVRKEMRAQKATLVVLDGFAAIGESAATEREFKKFVHELQVYASLSSCTFFLLSSAGGGVAAGARSAADGGLVQPVHTMVDGLVRLYDHAFGARAQRELHVQKLRGSRYLRGVHSFEISDDGIAVHPRLESFAADVSDLARRDCLSMGVDGLDQMMRGGVRRGTTTMILGPTGVGKTLLGYRFLACANPEQKGLLFSFYETPHGAIAKAESVGLNLAARCEAGDLELTWQSPVETSLDGIGGRILDAVERIGVARLFIDGFDALQNAAAYPDRVPQFFAALCRELHARGVTTMHSAELRAIFSPQIQSPVRGISPLLENLILLRFVERRSRVRRAVSILKLRDSDFDSRLREFVIDSEGLRVTAGFDDADAILSGTPHSRRPELPDASEDGAEGPTPTPVLTPKRAKRPKSRRR